MPKIVDRDQYRKELLIKSFDLFAQKGYGSITMRQLAQGLGVSTGTLYHYFPSKEALFLQLVEEQTQQNILNFLAEEGNPTTLPERIETLFNFCTDESPWWTQLTLRLKNENNAYKINSVLFCVYKKFSTDAENLEQSTDTKHFSTKNIELFYSDPLKKWFDENVKIPLLRDLE